MKCPDGVEGCRIKHAGETAWAVVVSDEDGETIDTFNVVMPWKDATLKNALTEALKLVDDE